MHPGCLEINEWETSGMPKVFESDGMWGMVGSRDDGWSAVVTPVPNGSEYE